MRALAQFEDPRSADRLGGVLYHAGIENVVEKTRDGMHTVWVIEEQQLDQARGVLKQFEEAPADPRFESMAKEAKERAKRDSQAAKELGRKSRHSHVDFKQRRTSLLTAAPVTAALIAICVALYVVIEGFGREDVAAWLYFSTDSKAGFLGYSIPQAVDGQWWRIITPIFMHAPPGPQGIGLLHIFFNMWWMKDLGPILERVHGHFYLLALVLVSAVGSNCAQYLADGPNFLGMSGVVYGLFGFLWIRGKFDPRVPYRVPNGLAMWMMAWFILCWLGFVGHVANMAHTGGVLVGAIWGFVSSGYLGRRAS